MPDLRQCDDSNKEKRQKDAARTSEEDVVLEVQEGCQSRSNQQMKGVR